MAKITKRQLLGVTQEATQGTAATVAVTDYIQAQDVELKIVTEKLPRDYTRNHLDGVEDFIGKKTSEVSFKVELKGGNGINGRSITAHSALSALLEGVGLSGGVDGLDMLFVPTATAAGATYYGAGKSVTFNVYKDGIFHTVTGALGSMKVGVEAGKIAMLDFSFKGGYYAPSDATMPAATPKKHFPPIVQSAGLSIHGFAPVAAKLDIDLGTQVSPRDDINSTDGLAGFQITSFDAKGSVDPEVPSIAAHNFFGRLSAGTTGTGTVQVGSTSGNMVLITMANVQYSDVSYGDRNGLMVYTVPLKFSADAGNDCIKIRFK